MNGSPPDAKRALAREQLGPALFVLPRDQP